MNTTRQRKSEKVLPVRLLFAMAIFLAGLMVISCGKSGHGPTTKVNNPNAGQYAPLFNKDVPDTGDANNSTGNPGPDGEADEIPFVVMGLSSPTMANKEFTIEAWVKDMAADLKGAIFSRAYDNAGLLLYAEGSLLRFAMRRHTAPGTTVDYVVDSGVTLDHGVWAHAAASLVDADHSAVHAECVTLKYNNVGRGTSIAKDANGFIHIAYYDLDDKDLKYATNTSGSWAIEVVDSAGDVGQFPSIALDSSANPNISYVDTTNANYKYAKHVGGGGNCASSNWNCEIVVNGVATASYGYNDIAIDSTDTVHIVYLEIAKYIGYAKGSSGSWEAGTVRDFTGRYNFGTSIAVDSFNTAHIIIHQQANQTGGLRGDLRHLTDIGSFAGDANPDDWNTFSVETLPVDSDGDGGADVGEFNSLVIDSSTNNLHVSYNYDSDDDGIVDALRYMTGTTGSWSSPVTIDTVDAQDNAIGINNENGMVYISYYDNTSKDLRLAARNGGAWGAPLTLDSSTDAGQFTSITSDGSHISYFRNLPTHALRMAMNSAGSWSISTIDNGATTDTVLAGVRAETPHIDIYVDGKFRNCASTGRNFSDPLDIILQGNKDVKIDPDTGKPKKVAEAIGAMLGLWVPAPVFTGPEPTDRLNAVVDDVRFWITNPGNGGARSQAEINQCMKQELSIEGGACGIDNSRLKGYWKFNEGQGTETADHSGSGNSGVKTYCDNDCAGPKATAKDWNGGWTAGYPF